MSEWLDFKELRRQLDFGEVLRHYGVELKLSGDQHHSFCPLPSHQGKRNSPSFSANVKRGIWQCFGCGQKGNLLDFAVLMEKGNPESGEDVRRVAAQLRDRFVTGETLSAKLEKESAEPEADNVVVNATLDFHLKRLDATHPYLFKRGFNERTIEKFGLGYCSHGFLAGRVAIPIHNREGNLVGYAGRLVNDDVISEDNPKYKFPGRRNRKDVIHDFRKSFLVYNAHRITAPVDDLVIVEGFTDFWWLTQSGIINTVAPMGASCSVEQSEIMVSLVSPSGRVWILTDGDPAGERCAHDIFANVGPYRLVRWIRLGEGKQPTDFSAAELGNLLPFVSKQ